MSTPISRVSRLLNEGARFMVELPGQAAIDLTPDVMAALNDLTRRRHEQPRIPIKVLRPTCVINPPGPGVPIDLASLSKHTSPCANTDQESSRRDDQRREVPTGVHFV